MKRISTFILLVSGLVFSLNTRAQTTYATIASGAWSSTTEWESYSTFSQAIAGTIGTGTPYSGGANPTGTHNAYIRSGTTVTMADLNRGVKSIIIPAGGKLWGNGNTADRRLQIGAGGTGFAYPLIDTVQIDGTLGGASDPMYIETGANAQQVKVSGSGTIDIKRIRTVGGAGAALGGVMNFDVNNDINLWQATNYALSIVYTGAAITDNYTFTIFPGKTVAVKTADGYFHNSLISSTYGNYTYLIKGTLDLSANTQTANNISGNITVPGPATANINVTVDGGTFKMGAAFKADTNTVVSPGTGQLNLKAINGGVVDGTLTSVFTLGKSGDGVGGYRNIVWGLDATSTLKLNVPTGVKTNFYVGLNTSTSPNTVTISTPGAPSVFTVQIKATPDNLPPSNYVNRQWTITKLTPTGSDDTLRLSWTTADQNGGFNPAGSVAILRWNGSAYETHSASVTGTGTVTDPYVAKAFGFTAFSPFVVANAAGGVPITFQNSRAFEKNAGVQVEWATAQEINVNKYAIEKSTDGRTFSEIGAVNSRGNSSTTSNYSFFDANPAVGVNFYRIKSVDLDGAVKYTSVMKVNIGKGKMDMIISPNPVRGSVLNLQLTNFTKGNYTLSIYNNSGQKLYSESVDYDGGSSSQMIHLPSSIQAGTYNVQFGNKDVKMNKTVIIQ